VLMASGTHLLVRIVQLLSPSEQYGLVRAHLFLPSEPLKE